MKHHHRNHHKLWHETLFRPLALHCTQWCTHTILHSLPPPLHWQLACTKTCNMYYETSYELAPDLFCRPATKCTLFSHSPAEYMHKLVST